MLGAHSSYWTSRDFVRMIVIETGRVPGKESTLISMRPVKRRHGGGGPYNNNNNNTSSNKSS